MLTKSLGPPILVLLTIHILGCDPVFVIQGNIYTHPTTSVGGENSYSVNDVNVSIKCYKDYIPSGLQTKSNHQGFYRLRGIGIPQNCELMFDHPDFRKAIIKLDPNVHKAPDLGWYGYKVDVQLEKK